MEILAQQGLLAPPWQLPQIHIRDPFVLADTASQTYYLLSLRRDGWAQIHDGSIEMMALAPDLSEAAGTPETAGAPNYVTGGPFPLRTCAGELIMMLFDIDDAGDALRLTGTAPRGRGSVTEGTAAR